MTDTDLLRELRALRRDVALVLARSEPIRRPLGTADREWLAALLPAIDAAAGDAVWTAQDAAALALIPRNGALAAVVARYARGKGLRGLGKALRRCVGHIVGGRELRHVGGSRDGALWQCVRV